MNRSLTSLVLVTLGLLGAGPLTAQTPFQSLNYLYSISGHKTLSGIHNREPNSTPAQWTNRTFDVTGKFPALWSGDFLFQADNIENRPSMIAEAKRQWDNGALVQIMWHTCSPALLEPCGFDSSGVQSSMSDAQWQMLISDGTPLNNEWKARMDKIAVYLAQLKAEGVEVLFRPLHEMNQGKFWWGGRPGPTGTARLFQITHDYLTYNKGLTNLVWVWDLQDFGTLPGDLTSYNPGDSYWDILALDNYNSDGKGYSQTKYDLTVAAAHGKPIAIGECSTLPTPAVLSAQPRWSFFMGWSELVFSDNTTAAIQALYASPAVITKDQMPGWTPAPVDKGSPSDAGHISNLSARAIAGNGDQKLIIGVVVGEGNGTQPILIRGLGPSLSPFGVSGVLDDPLLSLFSGENQIAANDDWGTDTRVPDASAKLHAVVLTTAKDAAFLINVSPGGYTAQISAGRTSTTPTGVALAEFYDASEEHTTLAPRLINISARAQVGTGDNVLIVGFIIAGNTPVKVLIRGLGPNLSKFIAETKVLHDPVLTLRKQDADRTLIQVNDNWGDATNLTEVNDALSRVTSNPLEVGSKDSVILTTLAPGGYTAVVAGANDGTGIGLAEIYEVP